MGRFVPLLLADGISLTASMIAVNSLGRAFVPIDPAWPSRRIAELIHESGNAFVVTARNGGPHAGDTPVVQVPDSFIGEIPDTPWQPSGTDLEMPMFVRPAIGPATQSADVIVRHLNVGNATAWLSEEFGPDAATVVLPGAHPADTSLVWDHLWPLARGGRIVLPARAGPSSAQYLFELIRCHRVRTVVLAPRQLAEFLDHLEEDPSRTAALSSLRVLVTDADGLTCAVAKRLEHAALSVPLYGLHGLAAGDAAMFRRLGGMEAAVALPGTGVAVLDELRKPVPHGVAGELYLAGNGVGDGYLGSPAQTRRRFVQNRFSDGLPGVRLYRTGRLARMLPNGRVEFLGQRDVEAKDADVSGVAGDIATMLNAHPTVRQASVVAVPGHLAGETIRDRVAQLVTAMPPELVDAAMREVTTRHGRR
jgi:non-ribosomal peptide synthetase component F